MAGEGELLRAIKRIEEGQTTQFAAVLAKLNEVQREQGDRTAEIKGIHARLKNHMERLDIHAVPPCDPNKNGISECKTSIRGLYKWLLGTIAMLLVGLLVMVLTHLLGKD